MRTGRSEQPARTQPGLAAQASGRICICLDICRVELGRALASARAEALDEHPMAQPAVADRDRVAGELVHQLADYARAGEYHLGTRRLQPDYPPSSIRVPGPVLLDLAIDL